MRPGSGLSGYGVVVEKGTSVKPLPATDAALLLRTDFSSDAEWAALCEAVQKPSDEGFAAMVACVSDVAYDGLTVDQMVALTPADGGRGFAFIADQTTFSTAERPVLVVDLYDKPGRTFRVIPREMWGVENNLSLANMDYDEFADSVDRDGIFRGFS
jgi:hypothetical protein